MFEVRCKKCKNLLLKEDIKEGEIEVKCPYCNAWNYIEKYYRNAPLDRRKANKDNKDDKENN